jgi:hypothetical protein
VHPIVIVIKDSDLDNISSREESVCAVMLLAGVENKVCMYVCMCVCVYKCIHCVSCVCAVMLLAGVENKVCMYVCMCVCVYKCIHCVCCVCVCVHVCISAYAVSPVYVL